jgi:hypothetical protein
VGVRASLRGPQLINLMDHEVNDHVNLQ